MKGVSFLFNLVLLAIFPNKCRMRSSFHFLQRWGEGGGDSSYCNNLREQPGLALFPSKKGTEKHSVKTEQPLSSCPRPSGECFPPPQCQFSIGFSGMEKNLYKLLQKAFEDA